jgi:thiol-disulfide isomerase/thioredoxin
VRRRQRDERSRRATVIRGASALLAVAALVFSVLLAASYSGGNGGITPRSGQLPRVQLNNVIPGAPAITVADFQGAAVVVNFWASWCGACEQEMPTFQAIHSEFGRRVVFVGIDESDTRAAAISFLRHAGVNYPNGFDENGAVGQSFVIPGTPSTFFVSHGRELDVKFGPLSPTLLRGSLQQLFGL